MKKREPKPRGVGRKTTDGKPSRAAIVGERIRELRERRGWSQPELAYRAGLHPTDISRIENQQKDIVTARLVRLVVALDTSADYLLGLTTSPVRAR